MWSGVCLVTLRLKLKNFVGLWKWCLIACYPLVGISYLWYQNKPLTSTRQLACEPPYHACFGIFVYPFPFSSNRIISYTILQFILFNMLLNYTLNLEVDIPIHFKQLIIVVVIILIVDKLVIVFIYLRDEAG